MQYTYTQQILMSLDRLVNALFGGSADETMSAHFYRLHRADKPAGFIMRFVDVCFRWQGFKNHCERAFWKIVAQEYLPEEYRKYSRQEAEEILNRK